MIEKLINKFFATVGTVGGWIIIGSVVVFLVALICFKVSKAREKKREEYRESLGDLKRKEQVIKGVTHRDRVNSGEAPVEEPVIQSSGLNVARVESEHTQAASEVFAKVRKSRKKHQPTERELAMQKYGDQIVVNGYFQKSNTAPIRPVYSNTADARQAQKKELDSDEVGEEATTPAIVTDSAAPAKIKPTAPHATSARNDEPREHSEESESYVKDAIRPVIGSSVANAVTERPAEVPAETPKIVDPGEEEPIPTATHPVEGFAPAKREQVKRPKGDINTGSDDAEE